MKITRSVKYQLLAFVAFTAIAAEFYILLNVLLSSYNQLKIIWILITGILFYVVSLFTNYLEKRRGYVFSNDKQQRSRSPNGSIEVIIEPPKFLPLNLIHDLTMILGIMLITMAIPVLIIYWIVNSIQYKNATKIAVYLIIVIFGIIYYLKYKNHFPDKKDKLGYLLAIISAAAAIDIFLF